MSITIRECRTMFQNYPDVLNVTQVSSALGVSTKMVYHLISCGKLAFVKVGRSYKIAKLNLIRFILDEPQKRIGALSELCDSNGNDSKGRESA